LEYDLGGYEAAEARSEELREAYIAMGRVLGSAPGNIALVQNSTVAFAQAISAFDFRPGDIILTSQADYASNQIMYLSLARRRGVGIVRAPDTP
jgi:selenocysteine lyase/cysteine desulfurase